ncbi:MAG: HzsA-related protein, partial [Planctomycetota bacterium]
AAAAKRLLDAGIDKIAFIKRYTYQSSHYYTDFIDGCKFFGGNVCVLDLRTGKVKDLAPSLGKGIFGRLDVSFDAKKVIFDCKVDERTGFYIFEVGANGRGLRRVTGPPRDEELLKKKYRTHKGRNWCKHACSYDSHKSTTEDMHPCYLPDGKIAFASTRCRFGILCDGPDRLVTTTIYRMDANGRNMEKLTNSAVSEAYPSVMHDGRVLYTRWEYVDKGAVSVKCLWSMKPDGMATLEVSGQEIAYPDSFIHARQVPGHPNLVVFTGAPHCPQSGIGPILMVDTNRNIRQRESLTYLTPDCDVRSEGGFAFKQNGRWKNDRSGKAGRLFMDAYPITDKLFLVAMKPAGVVWTDKAAWRLCVMNEKGETEDLFQADGISCWQPYPLRPRKKPPALPTVSDKALAKKNLARVAVTDIYQGMTGVERGTIKYIRINEQLPRPWNARRFWGGDVAFQQHAVISRGAHHAPKVQWGVVPVEKDGSAHFLVPADKNIFFQALDEDYMEVQRQRTYINYRPGESRTCIGCHEPYGHSPPRRGTPLATKRAPSEGGPQPGEKTGQRTIYYPADVQPVLDKHCIKCHGGKKPKANMRLTGEPTKLFSTSYEQLTQGNLRNVKKKFMWYVGENYPKTGNVKSVAPKTLGSHSSLLVAMLTKGKVKLKDRGDAERARKLIEVHKELALTQAELVRITTWVDSNAQFYGSYWGRRNVQYKGHRNYRPLTTFEQAISINAPLPERER